VRLDGLDPELRRVAFAFNDLMSRLDSAMQQQRQLLSRASHALRTPVATIRTRAEVSLRREREAPAYREALAEIEAAARDASGLISQLLTLARLDEAREPLAMEEVAIATVAGEVARLLAPRAEEAGISLELDVGEAQVVTANRAALRELLEALLDNAVRYTPRGGRAGIAADADDGRRRLRVWDTGPGIPEAERPRMLERFSRGTAGTASGQPGSGLGLSVVKAIADAHGAAMSLGERPGGGLEVAVVFPAAAAQRPTGPAAGAAGAGGRVR
jgi:two-component system sensor histidine kinase TctE